MGDGVTLVSSAEECAKDVYKLLVRPRPAAARGRARAPLPHHRHARRLRAHRPAVPRARSWHVAAQFAGDSRDEVTVIGCAGSYPGPDSPASCYLVEADGRRRPHLADPARPRQRRARRAAPLRRPADHRRGASSATCTPTTAWTCAATTCCGSTTPTGAAAADPGLGPGRHRRTGWRAPTTCRGPRDDRGVRLPRPTTGRSQVGPFPVEPVAVDHPVPAFAPAGHADGATLVYTGDTGACDGARRVAHGRRPAARRGVVPRRRRQPADDLHLTGAEAARTATRAGVGGWCSPTSRRGTTRRTPWPRPGRVAGGRARAAAR